ncbi:MAG: hypothetical protein WC107_04780 [Patescibacteria group bacterium]
MEIKNRDELNTWLFDHAQIQSHFCHGIKGWVKNEFVNIAFVDMETDERIEVIYED